MAHRITLYDTLGVKSDASEQDIRAAFRRLTRDHHPDRFSGPKRQAAEQRFQAITDARIFNILVPAGAALTAGGALWFFLEPAPAPAGPEKEPGGPKSEPTPVGFLLTIGGEI